MRVRVAWALGEIRDHRAVEPHIQSVNDGDGYVCWSAAVAWKKSEFYELLTCTKIKTGRDEYLRRAAEDAMQKIHSKNR